MPEISSGAVEETHGDHRGLLLLCLWEDILHLYSTLIGGGIITICEFYQDCFILKGKW